MKLIKTQYKKLDGLIPIARSLQRYQTTNHVYNVLHNRKWLQMDGTVKKIWKLAHNLCEI